MVNRILLSLPILFFLLTIFIPAPVQAEIPPEAKKYMARGEAAVEEAKNISDYKEAAEEFKKAVNAAPRYPEAHYNLGVAQEGAGLYSEAIRSFKQYMKLAPDASDTEEVQAKIFKLEYKTEKAARPPTRKNLAGRWVGSAEEPKKTYYKHTGDDEYRIEDDGKNVKVYVVSTKKGKPYSFFGNFTHSPMGEVTFRFRVDGNRLSGIYIQPYMNKWTTVNEFPLRGSVSEDGNRIVLKFDYTFCSADALGKVMRHGGNPTTITMKRL